MKILPVPFDETAYFDVVREAQEIVELSLKGILRQVGIEPPKWHDGIRDNEGNVSTDEFNRGLLRPGLEDTIDFPSLMRRAFHLHLLPALKGRPIFNRPLRGPTSESWFISTAEVLLPFPEIEFL